MMDRRQQRAIEKHESILERLRSHLGYPGNAVASVINLNKKREARYWTVTFGCKKVHLEFAVENVGTNPVKVEQFVYGLR